MSETAQAAATPHVERRKLEARRRALHVLAVETITPRMLRITFGGDDLHDFDSPSPDDHVKVFFPAQNGEPQGRDYTPRSFDREARTLVLEFALHRGGVASGWARSAKPGDTLQIGGPRGTTIVSARGAWWLLIGDETALPSIGRRLETLPAGTQVQTLVAVTSGDEEQRFQSAADVTSHWIHRPEDDAAEGAHLLNAARSLVLPAGPGFIWIGAEGEASRSLRDYFVSTAGHSAEWIKASAYWGRKER